MDIKITRELAGAPVRLSATACALPSDTETAAAFGAAWMADAA